MPDCYLVFAQAQFVSHGRQEIRIASVLEKYAKSPGNKKQIASIFFVDYAPIAISLLVQVPESQRLRLRLCLLSRVLGVYTPGLS